MYQPVNSFPSMTCRLSRLLQTIRWSLVLPHTSAWWGLQDYLAETLPGCLLSHAVSLCCKTVSDLAVAEKPSPPDMQ